jgi:hypothetical protein
LIEKFIVALFLTITVIDISWPDVEHDNNSVAIITYSDGTTDTVVVPKKMLRNKNVDQMAKEIQKIIDLKTKETSDEN